MKNIKNIKNMEIIQITTENGRLVAIISFQDLDNIDNVNNGYDIKAVPINIREIQYSSHGNILVNQSIKEESTPCNKQ
jgi:hypothetical protein